MITWRRCRCSFIWSFIWSTTIGWWWRSSCFMFIFATWRRWNRRRRCTRFANSYTAFICCMVHTVLMNKRFTSRWPKIFTGSSITRRISSSILCKWTIFDWLGITGWWCIYCIFSWWRWTYWRRWDSFIFVIDFIFMITWRRCRCSFIWSFIWSTTIGWWWRSSCFMFIFATWRRWNRRRRCTRFANSYTAWIWFILFAILNNVQDARRPIVKMIFAFHSYTRWVRSIIEWT